MEANQVLCVSCGYNTSMGKRLTIETSELARPDPDSGVDFVPKTLTMIVSILVAIAVGVIAFLLIAFVSYRGFGVSIEELGAPLRVAVLIMAILAGGSAYYVVLVGATAIVGQRRVKRKVSVVTYSGRLSQLDTAHARFQRSDWNVQRSDWNAGYVALIILLVPGLLGMVFVLLVRAYDNGGVVYAIGALACASAAIGLLFGTRSSLVLIHCHGQPMCHYRRQICFIIFEKRMLAFTDRDVLIEKTIHKKMSGSEVLIVQAVLVILGIMLIAAIIGVILLYIGLTFHKRPRETTTVEISLHKQELSRPFVIGRIAVAPGSRGRGLPEKLAGTVRAIRGFVPTIQYVRVDAEK